MTLPVLLRVDGPPKGKGRPRFVRATGRTYTPDDTITAEERVRAAWRVAGSPDYGLEPIRLNLTVYVCRPKAHRLVNGSLSSVGQRSIYPTRLPDLDNVLKLVADALNGCAYRDDRQIIDAVLSRRWASAGDHDHTLIWLSPVAPLEAPETVAA